ncbi:aldehyde dehydrogenase family protein [Embleya sp. NPDC020886]|uniref:aldehyde dehydrogenase family protein n=1 Tax=Embleya sp. NPDC020886 TaxID=3363980 RepID=UPI0037A3B0CD
MPPTIYLDGRFRDSSSPVTVPVIDPTTEQVYDHVPRGTARDADDAVLAARRAADTWAATPQSERIALVRTLRDTLTARADELTSAAVRDVGTPVRMAGPLQTMLPIGAVTDFLAAAEGIEEPHGVANSLVHRRPVGVVVAITPWNYPLLQIVAKVVPALLSGSPVVLKPSEVAPLVPHLLAEAVDAAGFPPGVFNLVSGLGLEIGDALVRHPEVDMVSFTGSTAAGRAVHAAAGLKRVQLELGGKSASLVLPGADAVAAARATVNSCLLNSGQTCLALTRLVVHRSLYREAVEAATATAARFTLGDPADPATKQGPLISAAQRDRVRGFIERAGADGARLTVGGAHAPDGLERGFFVRPTVFADVAPESELGQEEVFGPVLAITPYDDVDEGIRIADGTRYGLSGAVWGPDRESAAAVALRLRTGQVDVNGGRFHTAAPFGGVKCSGRGREFGRAGLEEYYELQSLQL